MNENDFLDIYEGIAKGTVEPIEIDFLYRSLYEPAQRTSVAPFFTKLEACPNRKRIALNEVASRFYEKSPDLLGILYPNASQEYVKKSLDFLQTYVYQSMEFLTKAVGKTTLEDIDSEIQHYQILYEAQLKAGNNEIIVTPGELITLYRFSGDDKYKKLMDTLGMEIPLVVGGYASVEMVDREGHLITVEALNKGFSRYMKSFRTRMISISHSDVQVGYPLPVYINESRQAFKSGTDKIGLYLITEVRPDTKIAKRVSEAIQSGEFKSYSIAGTALDKKVVTKNGRTIMQVDDLELAEVAICLPATEKVWTKTGLKPISEIAVGELVLSHQLQWKPVLELSKRQVNENLVKITTSCGSLTATKEHPVEILAYDQRGEGLCYTWKPIGELAVGYKITVHIPENSAEKNMQTYLEKIVSIEYIPFSGEVFNLRVADDNSYVTEFATVHNCEKPVNQESHFKILKSMQPTDICFTCKGGNAGCQSCKDAGSKSEKAVEKSDASMMTSPTIAQIRKDKGDIRTTTKAIIKNAKGHILIIKDAYSDYWDLPGGHVKSGESSLDALTREVKEETSMDVHSAEERGIYRMMLGGKDSSVMFFDAIATGDIKLSSEHIGFNWIGLQEIDKYNLGKFADIIRRTEGLRKSLNTEEKDNPIGKEQARAIGDKLGIDWKKINLEQFTRGINVELEHGSLTDDRRTNITDNDLEMTAKIAWRHLLESGIYYTGLDNMEEIIQKSSISEKEIQDYIMEFYDQYPNAEAEDFDDLAEYLGLTPNELAFYIYSLISDELQASLEGDFSDPGPDQIQTRKLEVIRASPEKVGKLLRGMLRKAKATLAEAPEHKQRAALAGEKYISVGGLKGLQMMIKDMEGRN